MIDTLRLSWHVVARNWIVYKKDFIANISPTVADPLLILFSLGFGLSPFIREIEGLSYAGFLAPGLIATTALFTAFFECSYGFYVTMTFESVYKAMLTTPIGVREILIGQVIWVFLKGMLMSCGVGIVLACFGLVNPLLLPAFALIGGLLAVPCGAIGLLAAAYVSNINQFQSVYSFLIAPIYFLSGVFFPAESFPASVRWLVQLSPFNHGVRLMQMVAWGRLDPAAVAYHLAALVFFTLALGAWAVRQISRKMIS